MRAGRLFLVPVVLQAAVLTLSPATTVTAVDGCTTGTMTVSDVDGYDHVAAIQGEDAGAHTGLRSLTRIVFSASDAADASCTWSVPAGVTELKVLVVGGGGGGGGGYGGGGGGGGVHYEDRLVVEPGDTVAAVVGLGGSGGESCGPSYCSPSTVGSEGNASSLSVAGELVASAGGGGGGGRTWSDAPEMTGGSFTASGGGGGGGSVGIGTPFTSVGGIPPSATEPNTPWWGATNGDGTWKGGSGGGTGGIGGGGRSTDPDNMVTGGGGGAKGELPANGGDPAQPNAAVGAYGSVTSVEGDTTIRYGAGGAGVEVRNDGTPPLTFTSLSPTSGGSGGTPTSREGGDGVDGTGGGGGGARDGEGGDGGSGTVTLWYYRSVELSGPSTLATTRGVAVTSSSFTNSGGQFSHQATATWVLDDGNGGSIADIAFDESTRSVTVGRAAPIGTHLLHLTVTDAVGMSDSVTITVTVDRALQANLTFVPSPPALGRVGGDDHVASLAGGSGTGTYSPSIDPASSSVCSGVVAGTTITVSFLAPGTCRLLGDRAGDADHQDAAQISQSITVAAKESQAALTFDGTWPGRGDEGDPGFSFTVSGGSGTGAYSVAVDSGSSTVCSVSGSGAIHTLSHLGPGHCVINLDREGDNDHLPASTVQTSHWVRGLRSLAIDPSTFQNSYPWSGGAFDITGLLPLIASDGTAPSGEWHVRDSSGACTANVVPVIRVIGEGYCTVYAVESDSIAWVESATPTVTFRVIDRLIPEFATPTPTLDGFTARVETFDLGWNWSATTDAGQAVIDPLTGDVTVTALAPGESATVTVSTSRSGFQDGSATVTGTALTAGLVPRFSAPVATDGGFTVAVTNFDPVWAWSVTASRGSASIDAAGRVTVTGLASSESATLTVVAIRSGYADGSGSVSATSAATTTTTTTTTLPSPTVTPPATTMDTTTSTSVPASSTGAAEVTTGEWFTPLDAPVRVLDTRRTGDRVGRLDGTGSPIRFRVAGLNGVPATGVVAVAANVTVVSTLASDVGGFLTVFPCGARPDTSTLNFGSGSTVANAVIAPLSADGDVCIHVFGVTDVLFDVSGWLGTGFSALDAPVRLLDTRSTGRVGAVDGSGVPVVLPVAGVRGVPSSGVAAVAMNVTVVDPVTDDFGGFVTVYPCGGRPDASNLNFVTGQVVANSVVAPVSADGSVCFFVYGAAHLLVDVSGWLGTG